MARFQIMGRDGLWTSTTCTTKTVSGCGRKPKPAASGEEPSRMRAAPLSILLFQSVEAGVAEGATMMSADASGPNMWPTDERMTGQGLAWVPRTVKVPAEHRGARARNTTGFRSLFCKCIPDTYPEVIEIGPAGIGYVYQIDASNPTQCDRKR